MWVLFDIFYYMYKYVSYTHSSSLVVKFNWIALLISPSRKWLPEAPKVSTSPCSRLLSHFNSDSPECIISLPVCTHGVHVVQAHALRCSLLRHHMHHPGRKCICRLVLKCAVDRTPKGIAVYCSWVDDLSIRPFLGLKLYFCLWSGIFPRTTWWVAHQHITTTKTNQLKCSCAISCLWYANNWGCWKSGNCSDGLGTRNLRD